MDAARWLQLQTVLAAVIDVAPPQRAHLLDALCDADPALRQEVETLLACEHALPEQLPETVWRALAPDATQRSRIGDHVGPFEIEHCLGEGGSSVVYAARRVSDFAQRVAIKLLRSHAAASVARRFVLEREMLSRLNHPHIARLFDAGTLSDGTPYLVLELIEGRSWPRWLSEARPSLRERIVQFLSICDAVSHAHQHLLVHRDIKPTNIMVDDDGRAKLLDFGIAKLLDATDSSTLTRDGGFALTPAYAAPEQLRGEPVTTATDVYALGVVLYETLTAQHPFHLSAGASTSRWTSDAAAPHLRPSQVPQSTAHALSTQALRGDLDNIVMMALEPEPARRHASVAALGADLRAYLDGRPVSARPRTWRYVTGKFFRRHPLGVALAAAALLAVATSALVAVQEAQRARGHLAQARALAHDILIDYSDLIVELPGSLPVQQRMVQDAVRYLDSLRQVASDDSVLSQELAAGYLKIGDIQGNPYRANLGDFVGAERSYQQARLALAQWQRLSPQAPGSHLLQARLSARVAALDHQQGRLEAAASEFSEALKAFAALPAVERDAATALEHAGTLEFYADLLGSSTQASLLDVQAATHHHAQARQLIVDTLLRYPDNTALQFSMATSIVREGDNALAARDLDGAEGAYRDAIGRIEALLVAEPGRATRIRELAGLYSRLSLALELGGNIDAATTAAKQSVTIIESLLAADPINDQLRQGAGAGLGILAKLLIRGGRYDDAGPIIDRQIDINQRRVDATPDNGEMILALSLGYRRRGEQRAGLGDFAAAIQAHEQALNLQTRIAAESADNESHRALTLLHLGRAERASGNRDAAIARLQQAIAAMNALVAAHGDVAVFREDLIDAEDALGDTLAGTTTAGAHYQRAIELIDASSLSGELAPGFSGRRSEIAAKLSTERGGR
jgi:eukaryotic-like serine/threonine-protein kinase